MPLTSYLSLSAVLFCLGLYGVTTKKNSIIVLFSIELMLNAANINIVSFSKLGPYPHPSGQVLGLFSIAVAAAEAAVGLAILIALYRRTQTVEADRFDTLKG